SKPFEKGYSEEDKSIIRGHILEVINLALRDKGVLRNISALAAAFPNAKASEIASFAWKYRNKKPEDVIKFFREVYARKAKKT
ncbi:MAG: hypothetical protein DRO04_02780, partial [Candidatus Iainarchaeum archaeon]